VAAERLQALLVIPLQGAWLQRRIGLSMRSLSSLILGAVMVGAIMATRADEAREVEGLVAREMQAVLPADQIGGAAVAVLIGGKTLFFNHGSADMGDARPITADSLFNLASLRKVFEAILLAQAVQQEEMALHDPVSRYVVELQRGGTIRRVTVGQLASHMSGLLLPQDHDPWPDWGYTLPEFIATLNAWKPDPDHEPGRQPRYTHAGYVLLQLALERRFATPIDELMRRRMLEPLGLSSTLLPPTGEDGHARLPPPLLRRAVQGYGENGTPIAAPGNHQSYYQFPGTGQMFSSARDLARFLAFNLGELPAPGSLRAAMELAHRPVGSYSPRNAQALAWEVNANTDPPIVEKPAGLNNTSAYIGMMPARKLGIVILSNRGNQNAAEVGRRILAELAK
jgi:beta-lactamase class C